MESNFPLSIEFRLTNAVSLSGIIAGEERIVMGHEGSHVLSLARALLHPHSQLPPLFQESHRNQSHANGQFLVQGNQHRRLNRLINVNPIVVSYRAPKSSPSPPSTCHFNGSLACPIADPS